MARPPQGGLSAVKKTVDPLNSERVSAGIFGPIFSRLPPAAIAALLIELPAARMLRLPIERLVAEYLGRLDAGAAEAGFADIDAGDLDRLARARRRPRRRCPRPHGSAISKKPARPRAKPPKRGRTPESDQ